MPNDKEEKKEDGIIGKIALGVLIPLFIGSTVPWWWDKVFPTSTTVTTVKAPEASRDFFIGRWQVQQTLGQMSGETVGNYLNNGIFEIEETLFLNGQGRRVKSTGNWEFNELSKQSFHLRLMFNDGRQWQGKFKLIDQNHIQNTDQNYIAIRIN